MKNVLVVKVGTSTLLGTQELPSQSFDYIAASVRELADTYRVILVTSGAIGFGVVQMQLDMRPSDVSQLQALSMIGQVGLLRRWREAFGGVTVGQVLVTRHDLTTPAPRASFCRSVEQLWEYGAVPIVNENDAISNEEITFGDNDQLAAEVAVALGAKHLVLLTDQDGIQAGFGTVAQRRLEVVSIDEVDGHIMPTKSALGKGGASSKVLAARSALTAGVEVFVAHAATERSIQEALSGQSGTNIIQ